MRARDIAAGGHGAPLASTLDELLLGGSAEVAGALNLGGIANITIVARGAPTLAFDIGPANALIDAAVSEASGGAEAFDRRRHPRPPGTASTPRCWSGCSPIPTTAGHRRSRRARSCSTPPTCSSTWPPLGTIDPDDIVATATALTAITVADVCREFGVERLVVSGGGVDNPALMERLGAELPDVAIATIDDYGIPAGAKEAYLFALIGFLTVHELPGSVASATGAAGPAVLGCLLPGRHGFPTITRRTSPPTRLVIVT